MANSKPSSCDLMKISLVVSICYVFDAIMQLVFFQIIQPFHSKIDIVLQTQTISTISTHFASDPLILAFILLQAVLQSQTTQLAKVDSIRTRTEMESTIPIIKSPKNISMAMIYRLRKTKRSILPSKMSHSLTIFSFNWESTIQNLTSDII